MILTLNWTQHIANFQFNFNSIDFNLSIQLLMILTLNWVRHIANFQFNFNSINFNFSILLLMILTLNWTRHIALCSRCSQTALAYILALYSWQTNKQTNMNTNSVCKHHLSSWNVKILDHVDWELNTTAYQSKRCMWSVNVVLKIKLVKTMPSNNLKLCLPNLESPKLVWMIILLMIPQEQQAALKRFIQMNLWYCDIF